MNAVRFRRPIIALAVGILLPVLSPAQNMGFLKDSAVSYFDDDDVAMMMQNVDAALNDEKIPVTREWKNSASGHSGKAEVLSAFKNGDGIPCKRVRFSNVARNGVAGSSAYTFCKQMQKWMIATKDSK
jgi:hypothetical protein